MSPTATTAHDAHDEVERRLLHHRVLVHEGDLDAASAERLRSRLLLLACEDEHEPVGVYVASAGGTATAALAVADVLAVVPCPVTTLALGDLEGPAVLVLAAGTPGRRVLLPGVVLTPRSSTGPVAHRLAALAGAPVEEGRHDGRAAVAAGLADAVLPGATSLRPGSLGR